MAAKSMHLFLCVGLALVTALVVLKSVKPSTMNAVVHSGSFGRHADKTEWPELVGKHADAAKEILIQEAPHVTVQLVAEGAFTTMDFRTDRVRLWLDHLGSVKQVPRLG